MWHMVAGEGIDRPEEHVTGTPSANPYLFVVGSPRSGTTLLERMLDMHPRLAIIHESHWITRFFKRRVGITRDGMVTPELLHRLAEHRRFHLLKMSRDDLAGLLEVGGAISYADFVARIFDLYGERAGKPLVGDKTTGGYLRNLPVLHALWPDARIVHLVRDGRDVCLSMLIWPKASRAAGGYEIWKENPVATTALWWDWQVRLALEGGEAIGPGRYREVRYEALVARPADECRALCSFVDLPFDEALLRFNEGRVSEAPGLSANQAWLPPTPGIRDWRTEMPHPDVELFEALAGDLLSILGYDRAFDTISPAVAATADRFRAWWDESGPQRRARPRAG